MSNGLLELPDKPQAIAIEEAFELLTPQEFTLWMRLSVMAPLDLASGRTSLANLVGYKKWRFDHALGGLITKGFVRLAKRGRVSQLIISYAAAIVPPHHFVNFS